SKNAQRRVTGNSSRSACQSMCYPCTSSSSIPGRSTDSPKNLPDADCDCWRHASLRQLTRIGRRLEEPVRVFHRATANRVRLEFSLVRYRDSRASAILDFHRHSWLEYGLAKNRSV